MAPIIPDVVPDHFPAGTTVKFTRTFGDFQPSDGWLYTIYLNGLTQLFNKPATVLSNIFHIQFDPSDTAGLKPGPYRYAERLTKPATVFTLTGVSTDGHGNAVYSYSSVSGPPPALGMLVEIAGFTNSGNNANGEISDLQAGTFTIANAAGVNETHAATGTVPAETYDLTGDELVINIEPNAGIAPAGTFNTWEEQTLVVVEAAIAGRLTSDIQAYQIAGRSVSKIPIAELRTIRGELKAAIWRQNNPGQLGVPQKVTFTPDSEVAEFPPTWQDVTGFQR
jgi:hypothetical protein